MTTITTDMFIDFEAFATYSRNLIMKHKHLHVLILVIHI